MHLLLVLPVRADPVVEGELVAWLHERGHRVDRAHGDDEALWLAADAGFDALVIDRDGGDTDIPTLCSSLRSAGVWAPILLLTPVSDDQCVAALDAGADDYATEPVTEPELDARLRALVRRGQPARPSVLVVGSVQLDPGSRRVRAHGEELSITGADRVPGGAHDLLGSGMPLSGPEQIEFGGGGSTDHPRPLHRGRQRARRCGSRPLRPGWRSRSPSARMVYGKLSQLAWHERFSWWPAGRELDPSAETGYPRAGSAVGFPSGWTASSPGSPLPRVTR